MRTSKYNEIDFSTAKFLIENYDIKGMPQDIPI